MPPALAPYLSPDEFVGSMRRLRAANRSPPGALFLYVLGWIGYAYGVIQVVGSSTYNYYYYNQFWTGFGILLASLFVVVAVGRYMRLKRIEQVAAAVALEHSAYSARPIPIAWRTVAAGWRSQAVEIEVMNFNPQQQIESLQQQISQLQRDAAIAQQQSQFDQSIIAQQSIDQQQINNQQQWMNLQQQVINREEQINSHYPQLQPVPPPVARPVYMPVGGSVFAHPPPQYFAPVPVQPADNMRTPLMRNPY
jgi:hypothetical protein